VIERPKGKFALPMWEYILANAIEKESIYRICRNLKVGYHYKLFKLMEKMGWITLRKEGRECRLILTKEGRNLQAACKILYLGVTKIEAGKNGYQIRTQ
jgi:hypothetical protein